MQKPFFSVVIPAYNAANVLDRCLQSIGEIEYPNYECIVIDDGSTDNTASVVAQHKVRYIKQPNQGPATARNRGIEEAKGEFVFFTDSDCVVPPDILKKYAEKFDEMGDVVGIGGSYRTLNQESCVARYMGREIAYRHQNQSQGDVRAVGTFNAAFKKEILSKMGGFDTTFRKASGEDFELCYRIIRAGYKLGFDGDIFVWHEHPSSVWKYFKQQYQRGKTRFKNVLCHRGLAVSDKYVERGVQFHPPLIVLGFICLAAGLFLPQCILIAAACVLALYILCLDFIRFVWREEPALVPLAMVLLLMRPVAWSLGAMNTLLRQIWRQLTQSHIGIDSGTCT